VRIPRLVLILCAYSYPTSSLSSCHPVVTRQQRFRTDKKLSNLEHHIMNIPRQSHTIVCVEFTFPDLSRILDHLLLKYGMISIPELTKTRGETR